MHDLPHGISGMTASNMRVPLAGFFISFSSFEISSSMLAEPPSLLVSVVGYICFAYLALVSSAKSSPGHSDPAGQTKIYMEAITELERDGKYAECNS